MKKTDVICVGIADMDILVKNVDLSTGFEHESKYAEQVSACIGGDAANESIVLSHLGHSVQIMCGLGRDNVGGFLEQGLEKEGVDLSKIVYDETGDSAMNVIMIHGDGERNFINSGVPKAACFKPNIDAINDVKVVSMASLFLPPFTEVENLYEVAKKAKEIGAITCLDVIVHENSVLETYKDALQYVDYAFPNRDEAEELTGKTELEDIADVFLNYGVKNILIKIGKDGCFVKNQEGSFIVSGYKVSNVVDTTGAGDNFAAGFISGLLQEKSLEAACKYACGVAAVSIQVQGACTGVKSRQQVEEIIQQLEKGE